MTSGQRLARVPAALPAGIDRKAKALLAPAVLVACALTVAVGLSLHVSGVELGTALPPFLAVWKPQLDVLAVVGLPLTVLCAVGAVRLARSSAGPLPFALGLGAVAVVSRVALSMVRDGAAGWYSMLGTTGGVPVVGGNGEARNEYLASIGALDVGPLNFLDRYAEVVTTLAIHPSGHPPGMLLVLATPGLSWPPAAAGLMIVAGAAAVPLTYLLARRLIGEPAGRAAAVMAAFAPSALMYGATSADALFATVALLAVLGLTASSTALRAAGAVGVAVASFFSYALLAAGALAVVVVLRRDGVRPAVAVATWAGAAVVGFYALLAVLTGFDVFGALAGTEDAYRRGIASLRPYAFWIVGSPAAFLVAAGLPVTWYAARSLARGNSAALAVAAVIVVAAVAGFTKAETERIWLFLIPLLCVAAAAAMPRARLPVVTALLVGQAVGAELLLGTHW
ncbi:MAG: hypothetical protein ACR2NA_09460 [Solirubrobacterales bacterium]